MEFTVNKDLITSAPRSNKGPYPLFPFIPLFLNTAWHFNPHIIKKKPAQRQKSLYSIVFT